MTRMTRSGNLRDWKRSWNSTPITFGRYAFSLSRSRQCRPRASLRWFPLFSALSLVVFPSAARANWEYTTWGMSLEELRSRIEAVHQTASCRDETVDIETGQIIGCRGLW